MKAAVIGCGRMGAAPSSRLHGIAPAGWLPISHVEALQQTEGVTLTALCDVDEAVVEKHATSYAVPAAFTDYRRLLSEVRPEIVTVATRTPGKCDIVKAAIEHGAKGIYVEKPLANNLVSCREVLALAARAGVKVAYGVNRRYHAAYRKARQIARDGEIGDLAHIGVDHGIGPLLWAHPHATDLILFFADTTAVTTISAALDPGTFQATTPLLVDSDPIVNHANFTFAGPLTASVTRAGGLNVRLAGTTGNLTVHADGSWLELECDDGRRTGYFLQHERVPVTADRSATVTALTELVEAVRSNGFDPTSASEIEAGTAMLMGCVVSHMRNGARIAVGEIPAELTVTGRSGSRYA
jgi:scyllo-inositol 2-dehydrogenase (NAD+)